MRCMPVNYRSVGLTFRGLVVLQLINVVEIGNTSGTKWWSVSWEVGSDKRIKNPRLKEDVPGLAY